MSSQSGALLWLAFDEAARSHREATAFTDGSISMSYGQMHTRASAAAVRLRATLDEDRFDSRHVGESAVVALATLDPATTLAWTFGALSAGVSVAPIAADGPDRVAQLSMLRPDVIVTDDGVHINSDAPERATNDAEPPTRDGRVPPGMIVCTAGTTGAPKGVVHSHETLAHAVRRLQLFRLEQVGTEARIPGDGAELADDLLDAATAPALGLRYATTLPLTSMAGLTVAFQALLAGECLVMHPNREPAALLETLRAERVTNVSLTPLLAQLLLRAAGRRRPEPLEHLFLVGIGGGPVAPALAGDLEAAIGCPVAVGYGTTEAGGALTMGRLSDPPDVRHRTVGRPLPGVALGIHPGSQELTVRCASTAVGYLSGRRMLTAIDRGACPTGDVAHLRPDGAVELRGRVDSLILRGGRNIDPARIECALEDHPAVRRAAAFGVSNRLVAGEQDIWTVVELERAVAESELRAHCNQTLGASLTPRRVIVVDALPLTSDGAVRRGELLRLAANRSPAHASRP